MSYEGELVVNIMAMKNNHIIEHAPDHTSEQTPEHATTRNTIQRALVLEAVRSMSGHPTSADIYERVREKYPNISRATVYRNLGVLADRGEVLRVEIPNGADRYDYRCSPHFHAKCHRCGGIFDIDMPHLTTLVSHVEDAHGFTIEGYDIVFDGICSSCAAVHTKKVG